MIVAVINSAMIADMQRLTTLELEWDQLPGVRLKF